MNSILFVDDERINHRILDKFFESRPQYQIRHALSGREALDLLRGGESFDLIILDAMMPDMDGFETARKIRAEEEEFTPLIMLTALSDEKSKKAASEARINDFLTKPMDFFALELSLHNLLEMKRMFKEVNFFKNFYLSLIDSFSDSVLVLSPEDQILFSNFMAKKMIEKFALSESNFLKNLLQRASKNKDFVSRVMLSLASAVQPFEESLILENAYFQVKVVPNLPQNQIILIFKDLSLFYQKASRLESDLKKREQDLNRAAYIQKNLLQKPLPVTQNLSIRSLYIPSSSIGGDFHAIFRQGDWIAGIMADVSGHGIEAALYGTLFFMAVENHKKTLFEDTARFLYALEKEMGAVNLEHNFITALTFRYHLSTGELFFSNAGHCPPALWIKDQSAFEDVFNETGGPPICAGLQGQYHETLLPLKVKQFRMFFYTDGLVENFTDSALNEDQSAPLKKILTSKNLALELKEMRNFFLSQKEHPDLDDVTLLVLEQRDPFLSEIQITTKEQLNSFLASIRKQFILFDYEEKETQKIQESLASLGQKLLSGPFPVEIKLRMNALWVIFKISALGPMPDPFNPESFLETHREAYTPHHLVCHEKNPVFLSAFKKDHRMTEYCSRYESGLKGEQ